MNIGKVKIEQLDGWVSLEEKLNFTLTADKTYQIGIQGEAYICNLDAVPEGDVGFLVKDEIVSYTHSAGHLYLIASGAFCLVNVAE